MKTKYETTKKDLDETRADRDKKAASLAATEALYKKTAMLSEDLGSRIAFVIND